MTIEPRSRQNIYAIPLHSRGAFDQLTVTLDDAWSAGPVEPGDEVRNTALSVQLRARRAAWVVEHVRGLLVRRPVRPGDQWRLPEMALVTFTATVAGRPIASDRRVPGDPGQVTSTALGFGNMFGVTSRRSGATSRVLSTHVAQGVVTIEIDAPGDTLTWVLGSASEPVPFVYERQTDEVELADTVTRGFGVGVNIGGWDWESYTHIVSPALPGGIARSEGPQH